MQAANGVVRCGSCMEVFLADQNRITLRENKESKDNKEHQENTGSETFEKAPAEESALNSVPPDALSSETPSPEQEDIPLFTMEPDIDEVYAASNPELAETEFIAENSADNGSGFIGAQATEEATTPFISWETLDGEEQDQTDSLPEQPSEETTALFEEQIFPEDEDDESDKADEDIQEDFSQASPSYTENKLESLDNPLNTPANEDASDHVEQKNTGEFSAFLNPAAYQVKVIDFSFDLTPKDNTSADMPGDDHLIDADSSEQNALQDDDYIAATEDESGANITVEETVEEIFEDGDKQVIEEPATGAPNMDITAVQVESNLEHSAIPTLTPDFVASEGIPVNPQPRALAWSPVLKKASAPDEGTTLVEKIPLQTDDEKAFIHNNLSTLIDADSLLPLPPENLQAINDEPVELTRTHDPLKKIKTIGLALVSVLLIFSLAGQYAWFNLDSLIEDERFEPITSRLCNFIECPDTSVIDLTALITEELLIRSHPTMADALLVNFIFRNDAAREQKFPLVELNFTNNNGTIVANRVFTPLEYLPPEMYLFTHMPAHSSIQVSLELVDPGDDATGYSLVFRNP